LTEPLRDRYNFFMKQNVTVIFGTRPELIKLAPVIHRLRQFPDDFAPFLLATAQHRQMLDQVLSLFDLTPDRDLDLMVPNQTLDGLSARVMSSVSDIYREHKPDVVVVQGDTTTAMVAALAAFYQRIPVAHVEAGLRTGDIFNPFPEEVNRRVIGSLATFHFPPTVQAGEALEREGVPAERVLVTGNTVVDALQMISPALDRVPLPLALPADRRFVLVTAHRRENFGEPMENICGAIRDLAAAFPDVELVYPVHPNPHVRQKTETLLRGRERIHLLEPLNYLEFLAMMKRCTLILSDSGGVQEEAPTFGKPVLVMRHVTERPEGVAAGVARLVGTDRKRIVDEVARLLGDPAAYAAMVGADNPYGDGRASERICASLKRSGSVPRE